MLIGVTGNIGAGKSRVAQLLAELLKAIVVSADDICRALLQPGAEGYRQFVSTTGSPFVTKGGELDRTALREALFDDERLKKSLESILHPLVRQTILEIVRDNPGTLVVAEVPLLFESGWQADFDVIISVYSSVDQQIARVVQRDHSTPDEARRIIDTQMNPDEKNRLADYVVFNEAGWDRLREQVEELAEKLKTVE